MVRALLLDFHYQVPGVEAYLPIVGCFVMPLLVGIDLMRWGVSLYKSEAMWKMHLGFAVVLGALASTIGVLTWLWVRYPNW
ncbi:MAG: hypothetical protein EOO60_13830 [Hymenobacter sp.]|nr:MAG: hypothetical protein EOO60_13830 [Hymenobacter sp.]